MIIPWNIAQTAEALRLVVNIKCRLVIFFSFGSFSIRKHGGDLGLDVLKCLQNDADTE